MVIFDIFLADIKNGKSLEDITQGMSESRASKIKEQLKVIQSVGKNCDMNQSVTLNDNGQRQQNPVANHENTGLLKASESDVQPPRFEAKSESSTITNDHERKLDHVDGIGPTSACVQSVGKSLPRDSDSSGDGKNDHEDVDHEAVQSLISNGVSPIVDRVMIEPMMNDAIDEDEEFEACSVSSCSENGSLSLPTTEEEEEQSAGNIVQNNEVLDSSPSVFELTSSVLKLPSGKQTYNLKSQVLCKGVVANMDMEEMCGQIRILPFDHRRKDISFDFEDVKNATSTEVFLKVGSPVHFQRDTHDILSATVVIANSESNRLISVPSKKKEDRIDSQVPNDETEHGTLAPPSNSNMVQRKLNKTRNTTLKVKGNDGIIASFKPERGFGFISSTKLEKDAFVHINRLFTDGLPIAPQKGMKVRFVLNSTSTDPKGPQVDFALILDSGSDSTELKKYISSQQGTVTSVNMDKMFAFLTCQEMESDIHLDLRKISEYCIPLLVGDVVTFQVDKNATKPSAFRASVLRYEVNRSNKEINEFLDSSLATLHSSKSAFLILELAPLDALWQYFGTLNFSKQNDLIWKILQFTTQFFKQNRSNVDLGHILEILAQQSHFLDKVAQLKPNLVVKNFQIVFEFCEQVIAKCPNYVIKIYPLMIMGPKPLLETLMLKVIQKEYLNGAEGNWQSISDGITEEELSRDDLVKGDKNLSRVKVDIPYDSELQYMDTYFRLLRAEAFHAIQEGISCLRKGTLKPFQMKVYEKVSLGGVNLENLNLALCVSKKQFAKTNWAKTSHLMPGNLLCLLLNRQLKQFIWMTVAVKDPEILAKEGYFMADICSFNTMTKTEILSALFSASGQITMVESPTFFKSVHPALQTFRNIELEQLKLRDFIVHATPLRGKPAYQLSYFQQGNTEDSSEEEDELDCMERLTKMEAFIRKQMRTMDDAQKQAFEHVLYSPLGIIQGPPGTGKTYIGTKVIETILKYQVDSPILVLTYKNHALDEFLKQCLEFCPLEELVRVGGRSKEPALEPCNLFEQLKTVRLSRIIGESKTRLRESKEELTIQLKELLKTFWYDMSINAYSLLYALTEDQLNALVRGVSWGKGPNKVEYATTKNQVANNTWVSQIFDNVVLKCGTIKSFLERLSDETTQHKNSKEENILFKHAKALLDIAVRRWLPSLKKLEDLKDLRSEFDLSTWLEDNYEEEEEMMEETLEDQEYLDELLANRDSHTGIQGSKLKADKLCPVPQRYSTSSSFTKELFPSDLEANPFILRTTQMWALSEGEKYRFIFSLIHNTVDDKLSRVEDTMTEIVSILEKQAELSSLQKVEALSSKKIIGMTITGASINSSILQQVRPKVVIVEEAAEVLEPQLVAALNECVEHLILIGDHQQLRPQVESYPLVKNFNFDVSMMERLILCKFPYKTLTTQNRMRPEFATLLSDIYSVYKTNLERVANNNPPDFMGKSMFFWTHNHHEDTKERGSKTNLAECNLVIVLVKYLMTSGVNPEKITILAPYLGQVKLIRSKLISTDQSKKMPSVQTVDMFQGDENDVIVVSLVRSNHQGNVGFLNSINRRCVLQSRAKCGFYIVGDESTLIESQGAKIWKPFVQSMKKQGCLGPKFPLKCNRHPSQVEVATIEELAEIIRQPIKLCSTACGILGNCGIHACIKTCFPKHSHTNCTKEVKDTFQSCGHQVMRPCWQDIGELVCRELIDRYLSCGHVYRSACHSNISGVICKMPCQKTMNCVNNHACQSKCGKPHEHSPASCEVKINYSFPTCKHPSSKRKKCGEIIKWKCSYELKFTGTCGHPLLRKCYEAEKDVICKSKCIGKTRSCGHPCFNYCGENCYAGKCSQCQNDVTTFQKNAEKKARELKAKLGKDNFALADLDKSDAQYFKVQDHVTKYVQTMHNWSPTITRIQLVKNLDREIAYEKFKSKGFGTYEDLKFHGTSDEGVKKIPKEGFRRPGPPAPGKRPGMFGQGIYFATDSSKSAQSIYTQGSNKLLLCQVFLGKTLTLNSSDNQMDENKLKGLKCDSVFAPRGSSVKNDEFVVYNQDQAYVKYIVHFYSSNSPVLNMALPTPARTNQPTRRVLNPSRHFSSSNPDDILYRIAESTFYRSGQNSNRKIKSVEYVTNPTFENDFLQQKGDFKRKGIPDDEILAFHGTSSTNVDNILKTNLSLNYSTRFAHGKGLYFSEYPAVSFAYGDTLMLFKVLPGHEYTGPDHTWPNHQSKCVTKSADGYGQMMIVDNPKQFHPFFIYKLE
ncbi:hypothetical protein TCAL_04452 [Tigriopus californicus]|uniref:Poly [ADP-ribose] polymerase n=1 Tax=Tigriopus californicus TaxID=6832 RepID=A0A553NV72_TIGCA|nr:hypothetical protein TCAL_04452 [Tigriopus californicus]